MLMLPKQILIAFLPHSPAEGSASTPMESLGHLRCVLWSAGAVVLRLEAMVLRQSLFRRTALVLAFAITLLPEQAYAYGRGRKPDARVPFMNRNIISYGASRQDPIQHLLVVFAACGKAARA